MERINFIPAYFVEPMHNSTSKLNSYELKKGIKDNSSWHDSYKNSPFIYIGGIPYELNEGDILTVFAQYGKITKINLVRDKESLKSKGYAFIAYKNPNSAILAVDNFDGIKLLNRNIKVDHVLNYSVTDKNEDHQRDKNK